MAIKITYADGTTEMIPEAVRIDTKNFHEGMGDLYDKNGNLVKQISLSQNIAWEVLEMPESKTETD